MQKKAIKHMRKSTTLEHERSCRQRIGLLC